ncbi:phage tail protein [Pseudomonas aeruginosa]|nr:phage tail protein [Pseudomonas aeruginosa]PWH89613.1 phage tail protein [Pseudomonas aeruginosa]
MADVRPTKLQNDGNGYGSLREFGDGDTVPVTLGGTGAATAAGARTSLGLGSAAVRPALGSTGALYSRDSILGAVSQSSGVPTGAVIQRGSDANGEYVRFADGTQICWHRYAAAVDVTGVSGSLFITVGTTLTFPAAFVSAPVVSDATIRNTGYSGRGWGSIYWASASSCAWYGFSTTSSLAALLPGYIATGRWF